MYTIYSSFSRFQMFRLFCTLMSKLPLYKPRALLISLHEPVFLAIEPLNQAFLTLNFL